ncbi:hypothetical protein B0H63DRAFT_256209 [Podospora didyma]|uniref:Uncharacterized protein n=1 Tax=Podospora didyma TaxID=330526 RepID=A0AAE0KDL9_9PEZI|nr:hypothetical protein B0H63DRAFT_256209 [Podospora didyma]
MATEINDPPNGAENKDAKQLKMPADIVTERHMKTLDAFVTKLNDAAQDVMKASRIYNRVACLVTYWAEGDRPYLKEHGTRLWDVLKNDYGFEAGDKPFEIPKDKSTRALYKAVDEAVFDSDISSKTERNLFIMYYGGHATENGDWQPKVKSRVSAEWSPCQGLLADADCDLLFLFDCCYGGAMIESKREWKQRCEMLSSAAPSNEASGVEEESFTYGLVEELRRERRMHNGCDIVTLHSLLNSTRSRDVYRLNSDPWYWMPLSRKRGMAAVSLHPMHRVGNNTGPLSANGLTPAQRQSLSDARMLLKVSFSNPSDRPLLEEWKQFLRNRPDNILDVDFYVRTETKLHAVFETHSNTAVMSIPLWLWDLLEPHPAIQAISVVRSHNLVEPPPGPSDTAEEIEVSHRTAVTPPPLEMTGAGRRRLKEKTGGISLATFLSDWATPKVSVTKTVKATMRPPYDEEWMRKLNETGPSFSQMKKKLVPV